MTGLVNPLYGEDHPIPALCLFDESYVQDGDGRHEAAKSQVNFFA